jgi:hypothetical protein
VGISTLTMPAVAHRPVARRVQGVMHRPRNSELRQLSPPRMLPPGPQTADRESYFLLMPAKAEEPCPHIADRSRRAQ